MPEEKVKIKDLLGELEVQAKDMLRALRELGLSAKSTAGSVSVEDAARLRGHFAGQKQDGVERTEVQPNVIVRRRRKDAAPAAQAEGETVAGQHAAEAPGTEAAARPEGAPQAANVPTEASESESAPGEAQDAPPAADTTGESRVAEAAARAPKAARRGQGRTGDQPPQRRTRAAGTGPG